MARIRALPSEFLSIEGCEDAVHGSPHFILSLEHNEQVMDFVISVRDGRDLLLGLAEQFGLKFGPDVLEHLGKG